MQTGQIDIPFIAVNNKGLEVKNITKVYDNKRILDNVSIDLNRGESVALLGPNGAGKTSLFYIIMGLIKSESGSINLNQTEISAYPMYRRSKLGLGYLPQESSIFRGMNVEENILSILEKSENNSEESLEKLTSNLLKVPNEIWGSGNCSIKLKVFNAESEAIIELGGEYLLKPSQENLNLLRGIFGSDSIKI